MVVGSMPGVKFFKMRGWFVVISSKCRPQNLWKIAVPFFLHCEQSEGFPPKYLYSGLMFIKVCLRFMEKILQSVQVCLFFLDLPMPQKLFSLAVLGTDRAFFVIRMDYPKCAENNFGGDGKIPDIFFPWDLGSIKGTFSQQSSLSSHNLMKKLGEPGRVRFFDVKTHIPQTSNL